MPAKVNRTIVLKVNQETIHIINLSDVQDILLQENGETVRTTSEKFAAVIHEEYTRWLQVVRTVSVTIDMYRALQYENA